MIPVMTTISSGEQGPLRWRVSAALAVIARAALAPSGVEMATLREAAIVKKSPPTMVARARSSVVDDTARSDLEAQMRTILAARPRGIWSGQAQSRLVSAGTRVRMLDGFRFDADIGANGGEPSGKTGKDGQYTAPKTHILVTTQKPVRALAARH